jgi:hypothetical protein
MQNQRRSHSLQPINRAPIVDSQYHDFPSLVSTNNLAQFLLQSTIQRPTIQRLSTNSTSSSSQAPSLEQSPPVSRRTTSRPNGPPPPTQQPPPYTSSDIFGSHQASVNNKQNQSLNLRLEEILQGFIPNPIFTPRRRNPAFQPSRIVDNNVQLINEVKHLLIKASELHQDIEVKLTRIQLRLLKQEFERQDATIINDH